MALAALIRTVNSLKQSNTLCLLYSKEAISTIKSTVCNSFGFCSPTRKFYQDFFKISPRNAGKMKASDGVPNNYTLIYVTSLQTILKYCYPGMLLCTIIGPSVAIYDYYVRGIPLKKRPTCIKEPMNFINLQREVWIFVGAMIAFAATFCAVLFKTPFRVYKHNSLEQRYIAIFQNVVPFKTQHFHFKSASQATFKNPLLYYFKDCHYLIDRKKVFLFYYSFRTPGDLCDMLGVD